MVEGMKKGLKPLISQGIGCELFYSIYFIDQIKCLLFLPEIIKKVKPTHFGKPYRAYFKNLRQFVKC